MSFIYDKKFLLIKINEINKTKDKDKINLFSIGKTNLLFYKNQKKKIF